MASLRALLSVGTLLLGISRTSGKYLMAQDYIAEALSIKTNVVITMTIKINDI